MRGQCRFGLGRSNPDFGVNYNWTDIISPNRFVVRLLHINVVDLFRRGEVHDFAGFLQHFTLALIVVFLVVATYTAIYHVNLVSVSRGLDMSDKV